MGAAERSRLDYSVGLVADPEVDGESKLGSWDEPGEAVPFAML